MNKTLMTDFYELTMAQTYFDQNEQDKIAYFDIFFRKNPFQGGYAISGGLDNVIEYIKNFKYSESDIEYLRKTKCFSEEFLSYLKDLRFTGDIYAVEDGTPIFPNEPAITVKAKIIEAQLIETALLAAFNHGTLVTTAAKRITTAAKNIPVMEFGARRARGIDSAIDASKYAYIGGCAGTSNTLAAKKYKIPALGTMAHSLVCDNESEYDAFLAFAKSNPNNCVFLVDTYDTLKSGLKNAIKVADDFLKPNGYKFKGIRIDSGDLAYLAKKSREMLDNAGYKDTQICISNSLDEHTISSILEQGAPIDSIGCGDNIAASNERVGGVYKLVAIEKDGTIIPKIKVSNDNSKTITPGYKRLYRFYDNKTGFALGDVLALGHETIPEDEFVLICPTEEWKTSRINNYTVKELQKTIFKAGKLVYRLPSVKNRKKYCEKQFATLYPELKRKHFPHEYYVDFTESLLKLKKDMIAKVIKKR